MSIGLLGNKIGMTQIFDESGNIIPVTILKIGPCIVTQIKTILEIRKKKLLIQVNNLRYAIEILLWYSMCWTSSAF